MDPNQTKSIEHQLVYMQRELADLRRRYRRTWGQGIAAMLVVTTALVAEVAGPVFASADVPDVVRATRFQVVDEQGNVRAELTSRLQLRDELGALRVALGANNTKAFLFFYGDEKSKLRAEFGADKDERGMWLYDEGGTRRLVLAIDGLGNRVSW